ncbi:32979_t:CDS:2 [Gigaspora margarita]|uniref:32979_t:CDS:1 n=1 Tax=Gigaspora margarita TaxID=4874 RepID=A0ABN7WF84_GIGMA|nr:32979_t:CDS:2 [Gigaspora margarita]
MLIVAEENNKKLVPLKKVVVNACGIYEFIVSDTAAVCGFEATIDGKRKVIGIVKEAEQAKNEYKEAINVF